MTYDPGTGHVTSAVTVTLHNDAPASGLPPIVLSSRADRRLPPGTNQTWLSVYTPLQFLQASSNGRPLLLSSETELGVKVYSAYIDIPPGGTVTVKLALGGLLAPNPTYALALRQQPMVNAQPVTVEVTPTDGWDSTTAAGAGKPANCVPGTDVVQQHPLPFKRTRP